jgi:renalase
MKSSLKIAIIGAGMAGAKCAAECAAHGYDVQLFEKSRGLGGRLATRRVDGVGQFDHGAQYFTARDARFAQQVQDWQTQGIVAEWIGPIASLDHGRVEITANSVQRYVGIPAMNAPVKALIGQLPVLGNTRIVQLQRQNDGWQLLDDQQQSHGPYSAVVLAIPALQAQELLQTCQHAFAQQVSHVRMLPCWALMLSLQQSWDVGFVGAFVQNSPLSWIANNRSKPGRTGEHECWVVHASGKWSQTHLEESPEQIIPQLQQALVEAVGDSLPPVLQATAHRWRYSIPDVPLTETALWDAQQRIGVCGDWCGGPRVEGAWLSGLAVSELLLKSPC